MRVSRIEIVSAGNACQLQGWVESDASEDDFDWFEPFWLWYRFPPWCLPYLSADNGDPFLAALILPAMRTRERLTIPAPVSPRLLGALPEIQTIYTQFDPRTARVPIEAAPRRNALPIVDREPWVALFFSMGIDSFYSLLKNQREHPADSATITHLISVHGFDAAHHGWDEAFPPALLRNFARVSDDLGKTLVPVVTNVRQVGARLAPWTMMHGAALASVALALGSAIRHLTIASSATYDTIYPWGTHPLLDPRWATETITVVHDGCEKSAIEKLHDIIVSELVLQTLRVCPGYGPEYNCGRCNKCMRTMVDLLLAGCLERAQAFPDEIDPGRLRVALQAPTSPVQLANFRKRLAAFDATGLRPDLRQVLAEHIRRLEGRAEAQPRRSWLTRISRSLGFPKTVLPGRRRDR
jgi:hypothetical protein